MRDLEHDETETRKEDITNIYKEILGREPDVSGLNAYMLSTLSVAQIKEAISRSVEAQEKFQAKNFGEILKKSGSSELLVVGSSPKDSKNVEELISFGIKYALDLNDTEDYAFDKSSFEGYLRVPISKYSPLTKLQIDSCFKFIYDCVLVKNKKLFVHSKMGFERPPVIMALFLVADKDLSFKTAISVLMSKHEAIRPNRDLITAEVLDYVYSLRGKLKEKYGGSIAQDKGIGEEVRLLGKQPVSPINILGNLYVCCNLNTDVVSYLKNNSIDTIIDLNMKPIKMTQETSWFKKLHLPVFLDQVDYILPTVLKSVNKYINKGKVMLVCEDEGVLSLVVEKISIHVS